MKRFFLPTKVIVPVLLIILLLVVVFGTRVSKVDVVTEKLSCIDQQEIKKLVSIEGKSTLFVSEENLKESIKTAFACVDQVAIEKRFPNTVSIHVFNRSAIAKVGEISELTLKLKMSDASPSSQAALLDWSRPGIGEEFYLIDALGNLFLAPNDQFLPVVLTNESLEQGKQTIKGGYDKISYILNKLPELNIIPDQSNQPLIIKASSNDLLFFSIPKVVFSKSHDIKRQVASLQLILNKAKIDSKEPKIIDLRFKKPIISYATTKINQ